MQRRDEIRKLLKLSPAQVRNRAGERLVVCSDIDALHQHFADAIAAEIKANNRKRRRTKLILPVGPVGQYPILAEMIHAQQISLKQCWFFMMDEHCDDNGTTLSAEHPLSFQHAFNELFASRVKRSLMIPARQLVFPDHLNVQTLKDRIASVGGIDTTYGGIGIHGHVVVRDQPRPQARGLVRQGCVDLGQEGPGRS